MKTSFLLCIIIFTLKSYSQLAPAIQWQNTIGGVESDFMYSLCQANDGGFILAGRSVSDSSGDKTENSKGFADYWIIKTDSLGNIQFQNTIGGNGTDDLRSVSKTSDGGYIFGGYSDSDASLDKSENSKGADDYWIVKTDSLLNIQWEKTIGGNSIDYLYSVKQTSDGGYILGGFSFSSQSGDKTENDIGGLDYWIVKTDANGNIEWDNTIGGSDEERLSEILQTNDHGYILAGWSYSNISGDKNESSNGDADYWVVKTDSLGNIVWQNTIGGSGGDALYTIAQVNDGGFLLGGTSRSGINGDKTEAGHGDRDYWIVKIDSIGIIEWQNVIGGNNEEGIQTVLQTPDSGFIVGGFSSSPISADKTEASKGRDCFIVKTDKQGNIEWQNTIVANYEDWITNIKITNDGYILGGYTDSNISGDKTEDCNGWYDYWLIKLNNTFNTISGKIFIDLNSNGNYDSMDVVVNAKKVNETLTGRYSFSTIDGSYHVEVLDTGTFIVSPGPINYYSATPSTRSVNFPGMNLMDSLNDFAYQPIGNVNDLCISITPAGPFRNGFNSTYFINYENLGTTNLNPTIIFFPDSGLSFINSVPPPSIITSDSIVWNLNNLLPFHSGLLNISVNVDSTLSIGTELLSYARIDPLVGDTNPSCNFDSSTIVVRGSFDPNQILTDHDFILQPDLANPPYIEYTVYFQNTGNDTAFNVKVLNPIDPAKLNVSTMELIASSSPVYMKFNSWENNIEFAFNNILLVDSNKNESLSHGFVRYKIKPFSDLIVGDTILNRGYIYFDFNKPVLTNIVETAILSPVNMISKIEENKIMIYPNPSNGIINIQLPTSINSLHLRITNLFGEIVYLENNLKIENRSAQINISNLIDGVYIVSLEDTKNKWFGKLIKQSNR